MMKYELNNRNIDAASDEVTNFLTNAKADSKDIHRIRLSIEEILLKYSERLGENKSFELVMSKRFRTLRIELSVSGESFDPFSEDDENGDGILHRLLSNLGLAPVWRYKNGKNFITFSAKKKKISQILQIGIAIFAAAILGVLCNLLPQNVSGFITGELITPVFNTFMGLLSAISGPIIFLSVVWGILGIGDMSTFGKIGKKMIGRFLIVSVAVGVVGTAFCGLFFRISATGETAFAFSDLYKMILDIVPGNLLTPFTEGNSLQIIFIAIIVGLAMLILGNRIPTVTNFIEQANSVMQLIMTAVSAFIPFFVFGSVLNMMVGNNFSSVAKSYKLLLVMILADIILMAYYLFTVSARKKVNPIALLKKTMPTFVIGLSTASAVAAYQTNVACCEKKLGIEKRIIDIGVPLGQVIFMPGAIVLFLCAAFGMAENYGVAITPIWMLTAFIISVVLAIAAPSVPGAALTCYTILFMQLGIPSEAVAVVITLNVILEFFTTAVNLFCLQTELVELSGSLKVLDVYCLRKKQK